MRVVNSADENERRLKFAEWLDRLILESPKTQRVIAEEIGYNNPNMITIIKRGDAALPMDKIAPLARALGVDENEMMRTWFETYKPEILPIIVKHFGEALSANERSWINQLRKTFDAVPVCDATIMKSMKGLVGISA